MPKEFTVQKQQPILNKQSFYNLPTNVQTPPPQTSTNQQTTILQSCPYFNFYLTKNNQIGPYQWEFVQEKKQIFRVNMTVQKNKKNLKNVVLHDFMMIHQNSRIDKHMFRAIYMKNFVNDDVSIEYWPVFNKKENKEQNKIQDLFFISFIVEEKNEFRSYRNVIPLITQISQAQENRDYSIQIDSDGINGFEAILKCQGQKIHEARLFIPQQYQQMQKNQLANKQAKINYSIIDIEEKMQKKYLAKKQADINYSIKERDIYINPFNDLNLCAFYEIQALNKRTQQFHDRHTLSSKYPNYKDQKFSKTIEQIKKKYINSENNNSQKDKEEANCSLEQQYLGDCYFHAGIHQVIKKASFIINKLWIFYAKDLSHVCVILNIDGSMIPVEISDKLLTHQKNQQLFYAKMFLQFGDIKHISDTQMYDLVRKAILIQKSFARVFREYKNLVFGDPEQVFMMLTNSCSKIHYSFEQQKQEQIQQMNKWMEQVDNLKQVAEVMKKFKQELKLMKQPQVPNEKQYKVYHYTMKDQSKSQNNKHLDIHLIAITFSDNKVKLIELFDDSLRKQQQLLANFKQKISQFDNHCYSFHGIFNHRNNKQYDEVYIKLRDPRGKDYARYWRALWDHLIINNQNIRVKDSNKQTQRQTYELLGTHQIIECEYNQFLLTYKQLKFLNTKTTVCILPTFQTKLPKTIENCKLPLNCFNSFEYRTVRIPFVGSAEQHYKISIKQQGQAWICLHKKNQRHGLNAVHTEDKKKDYQENKEITSKWYQNYPEALFRLYVKRKIQSQYKQNIITSVNFSENITKQVFYASYFFQKDDYDLKICLTNKTALKKLQFCMLSILSNHSKNSIMVDPQAQINSVNMKAQGSRAILQIEQILQIQQSISKRVDLFKTYKTTDKFIIQYCLQWKKGSKKLKSVPQQLIRIEFVKDHKKPSSEINQNDEIRISYIITDQNNNKKMKYLHLDKLNLQGCEYRVGRWETSILLSQQYKCSCLLQLIKANDFAQNVKLSYVGRFEKTQADISKQLEKTQADISKQLEKTQADIAKQSQQTERPCWEVFMPNTICQVMGPVQKDEQQKEIKDPQ